MRISTKEAICTLLNEDVVSIPTETVYGLAGLYDSRKACDQIFLLKERPANKTLSVLAANFEQISSLVCELSDQTKDLIEKFCPGPLTLILPAQKPFLDTPIYQDEKIAIRIPDHPLTLSVIQEIGPLACPSANPSGRPPPTNLLEVEEYFGPEFPILDGGICQEKRASTILVWNEGKFFIQRQGPLLADVLTNVLGYAPESLELVGA